MPGGVDLEGGGDHVPVEEVVAVLVARHPLHDLVAGLVVEQLAGVVVRDPRGELLEGHVGEAVVGGLGLGHLAALDLGHAGPLEVDGVDGAGDGEVVPDHDRVAALFGGPPTGPGAPGGVAAEHRLDGAEVVREVVLGEEVHEQGAAHLGGELHLVRRPLVVGLEVPALAPRHELVREPLLGGGEVAVEEAGSGGLQLLEEGVVRRHDDSLPTVR